MLRPKPGHAQTTGELMRGKETLKAPLIKYKLQIRLSGKKRNPKQGEEELALSPGGNDSGHNNRKAWLKDQEDFYQMNVL